MTPRRSFPNEVCTVYSNCGRSCIAIVARVDGLFQGFEDQLFYDDEEDVYYWDRTSNGYTGLYATAEDLARDVRKSPGFEDHCLDWTLTPSRVLLACRPR